MRSISSRIVPHLWFDKDAREAAKFYVSLFNDSDVVSDTTIEGTPSGDADIITFRLSGQRFMAINGGPAFRFSNAVSFHVYCGSDSETDRLYEKLSENGSVLMPLGEYDWARRYAWVRDRYGVSWQLDADDINHPQKIVPALLFVNEKAGRVREAVSFYLSVFPDSRLIMEAAWDKSSGMTDGALLFTQFSLSKFIFNSMSGGSQRHEFDFNEAISFMVYCKTQEEIDHYWTRLLEYGGEEQACGWLKDRFGVSWQIVPEIMDELMTTTDRKQLARVTEAMLKMVKLNIRELVSAGDVSSSD